MGIVDIPSEITELEAWAEVRSPLPPPLLPLPSQPDAALPFSQAYESEHMVPAECCRDVAAATIRLLIHNVPFRARGSANKVVACMMYDRLRNSIMFVFSLFALSSLP